MQITSLRSFFVVCGVVFAIQPLCLAAGVDRGTMLSNSCAACHGSDGKSPGAIPSIQGKSVSFITTALKEFRDGTRVSTVMGRHAKGYSDEEIELIATHFANPK